MNIESLPPTAPLYPAALKTGNQPPAWQTIGNQELLATTKTAVLCSRECPGEVILRLFELARRLRDSEVTFISGFHTPVERDFLAYLLAGSCELIICPARTLEGMRLPTDWQKAIADQRLLLLSPFTSTTQRRQSAQLAKRRNEFVIRLAEQILLLHAAPASQTARLINDARRPTQPLLTLTQDDAQLCRQLMEGETLMH